MWACVGMCWDVLGRLLEAQSIFMALIIADKDLKKKNHLSKL